MSQAEELLRNLTKDVPIHDHVVSDQDSYFVINPDTRVIENASRADNVLMQYDHNSEKYTFELARYVDGHDMTLCNRVRVHFNNVDGATNEENADVAELYDLAIDPDDNNKVLCSWTITRQATQLVGTLNFLVQYECIDDNGNSVYEWHTDIYTDVAVKKGRNNSEQAVIEYSNVLEQWYQRIFGAGDSVMADITAEGEKQVAAVTAEGVAQKEAVALKGEATLATIPDDYTETYNMAEEAIRRKANTIEMNAEGESISVNDSADAHLLGLTLYGKTTQKTTTGAQLIPQPYADGKTTINGVRFTVNPDGSVAASGTSTAGVNYYFVRGMSLPAGTYTFSMTGDFIGGRLYIYDFTALVPIATLTEDIDTVTFTTDADYTNVGIYINTAYEGKVFGGVAYPMLNKGSTALPYEQYTGAVASPNPNYPQDLIDASNPKTIVSGKNLWNPAKDYDASGTYWSWKVKHSNEKMTITLIDKDPSVDLKECYFGVTGIGAEPTAGYRWLMSKGTVYLTTYTTEYNYISVYPNNTDTLDKLTRRFYIMVELGEESTSYEDPRDEMTMTVNRGLSGIQVSSDGNYTDLNDQQWICDEIDFERGVYVQRVGQLTLTKDFNWYYNTDTVGKEFFYTSDNSNSNAKAWETRLLCSHFPAIGGAVAMDSDYWTQFSGSGAIRIRHKDLTSLDDLTTWLTENQVTIRYVLAEPVAIPLTEEEIAYYKKLKTYYHNTTVMNDSGARMAIKYSADTKMFFENHSIATDAQVEKAVSKYLEKNPTNNGMNESDLYNGVTMADRITGRKYIVYISNGKLVMDEE